MTVQLDVHELLGPELVSNGDGGKLTKVPSSDLKGEYVGIYFSAHWCPPCRQFTPALANTYSKLCKRNTNFQIVFVSGDRSEEQFEEYFASMPWLAVPFENAGARQQLMSRLNVMGIPCLVVVDPDGNVVCGNARAAVTRDPEGEAFPWAGQDAADSLFDWQNPRFWIMLLVVLYLLYNYLK